MKYIKVFVFVVLIFSLAACGSPAAPTLESTSPPLPTNTSIVEPASTPIPPTATLEPSPTPDPLLFRDDFEGSLGEGWAWTRENKTSWSLTNNPGWLEIVARPGYVGDGTLDNILLRPVPDGNFEIETKVTFKPVGDYQLAGLLVYESAANFLQFGRAFCDAPNVCAKDGFYVDLVVNNNSDGQNLATAAQNTEIAYLRLRREGNKYTMYASHDGQEWQLIGEKTSEMTPLFIGLLAGQAWSAPQPAEFDYFVVNQLP
jgi:beta-xylosidase